MKPLRFFDISALRIVTPEPAFKVEHRLSGEPVLIIGRRSDIIEAWKIYANDPALVVNLNKVLPKLRQFTETLPVSTVTNDSFTLPVVPGKYIFYMFSFEGMVYVNEFMQEAP